MSEATLKAKAELEAATARLAGLVTERHFSEHADLDERYGPAGRSKCRQDTVYHLRHLVEALAAGEPALFQQYVGWAKVMLEGRGVPSADLLGSLAVLSEVLAKELDESTARAVAPFMQGAMQCLPGLPAVLPSLLDGSNPTAELSRRYLDALLRRDRRAAVAMILDAADGGMSIRDIYLGVFERVQREVGRLWQVNEITVAEEHFCTAATQLVMSQLHPRIIGTAAGDRRVVVTCVGGDLHEIGARMVADFFELAGWDSCYLGANTPTDSVIGAVVDHEADVLAVSATMTFHVQEVAEVVRALRAEPSCAEVKVLVGGCPFHVDAELWRKVGADGTAPDAEAATLVAQRLVASVS